MGNEWQPRRYQPSKERYEYCFLCGNPTGRAGRGDDSIYDDAGDSGPYCEECWAKREEEKAGPPK